MKYKLGLTLAMASLAGFAFVGPGQAGDEFKNKYDSPGQSGECQADDKLEYFGPLKMWPPNHKLQPVYFLATNGTTGGPVSLTVTPGEVDDAVGGDGGPQHDPDMAYTSLEMAAPGEARVDMGLRSERSGRGDGRTYTLDVNATYDAVRSCSMTVVVTVPHDMRTDHWKDQ